MSIEQRIDALHAAMEANTAALNAVAEAWGKLASQATHLQDKVNSGEVSKLAAGGTVVAEVKPEKAAAAPKATKAEKPAPTPAAADPAPVDPAPTESASASPSDASTTVTLEDVQAALKAKVSDHRDAVVATLAKYGVKKASDLKADQLALALDDLNAIGGEDLT